MFQKQKRVRLKGRELKKLNDEIFERDNWTCINCDCYVSNDNKFHHEPCGKDKSDEPEKGVVLCPDCHNKRHNDKNESSKIRENAVNHLKRKYG